MPESNELGALVTGCSYVVNFALPFVIELALKSLLLKENTTLGNIYNLSKLYNKLLEQTQKRLQKDYLKNKEEMQLALSSYQIFIIHSISKK